MRTIRLDLEYDGTNYHGWQVQPNASTIQEKLEDALHPILGERVRVVGAGRTDAGVHALGQVAHFRTESGREVEALFRGVNSLLPEDIVAKGVRETPSEFHARKSALRKRYEYWILNDPTRSALYHRFLWHVRVGLDLPKMRRATACLVGEHDFASFQAAGGEPGRSTVRHLHLLEIREYGNGILRIAAEGNAFLRGMVRILAGTLVDVGRGRIPEEDVPAILEARDRTAAGRTAPGRGLFLNWVRYPEPFEVDGWETKDQEGGECVPWVGNPNLTNGDKGTNLV
jgi:tRNA pseudouridine38-40 synthase